MVVMIFCIGLEVVCASKSLSVSKTGRPALCMVANCLQKTKMSTAFTLPPPKEKDDFSPFFFSSFFFAWISFVIITFCSFNLCEASVELRASISPSTYLPMAIPL